MRDKYDRVVQTQDRVSFVTYDGLELHGTVVAQDEAEQSVTVELVNDYMGAPPIRKILPAIQVVTVAGGTHGRYLDFGSGRSVMLHGRERVVKA